MNESPSRGACYIEEEISDHSETETVDVQSGGEKLLTLENLKQRASEKITVETSESNKFVHRNNRTPSGNVLPNQQSVRAFFSPSNKSNKEGIKRGRKLLDKHANAVKGQQVAKRDSDSCDSFEPTAECEFIQPCETQQQHQHQFEIALEHDQSSPSVSRKRKLTTNCFDGDLEKINCTQVAKSTKKMEEMQISDEVQSEISSEMAALLKDAGVDDNVKAIDLRTVITMFKSLKVGMEMSTSEESIKRKVENSLSSLLEDYESRMKKLESDLMNSNRRAKMMEDIMKYNNELMLDMTKRIDSLELANARHAAILTGLALPPKKADKIRKLADFFYTELEVYARVEDAYTLGTSENSPTVIIFQTLEEKDSIFAKKSKLKEISKHMPRAIYLNNYLPAKENEKRKRERKIIKDLKDSKEERKPETSYGSNGFQVGNEKYAKKITAPDPVDLLNFTVEELDHIMSKRSLKGPQLRQDDSVFIPYGIDTADFQHIRDIYMKLRLLHPAARHIVCAFHLPGPDSLKHQNSDFCDDQENGAGAVLLREMEKGNVYNKALFVVRYCGKQKLSENRHSAYIRAARKLLQDKPLNTILDRKQAFIEPETLTASSAGYTFKQREERNDDQRRTSPNNPLPRRSPRAKANQRK